MINNKFRQALAGDASMFDRPEGEDSIEPKRFVVISAEGVDTEPDYFKYLAELTDEKKLFFRVLKHPASENTPNELFARLRECRDIKPDSILSPEVDKILKYECHQLKDLVNNGKNLSPKQKKNLSKILLQYGIEVDHDMFIRRYDTQLDSFAVVLDRDKLNHSQKCLKDINRLCQKENITLCLTNPCFEFWLFLHIWDKKDLPQELRDKMLENKKESCKHTFMSKHLSSLTKHNKKIPRNIFYKYYAGTIPSAIENANLFSTDFQDLLCSLGSNLGIFFTVLENKYGINFTQLCNPENVAHIKEAPRQQIEAHVDEQTTEEQTTRKRIILLLKRNPRITPRKLAESLEKSESAIYKQLATLTKLGILRRVDPDNGGYWEIKEL